MFLWVEDAAGGAVVLDQVAAVELITDQGMFNPYTMGGARPADLMQSMLHAFARCAEYVTTCLITVHCSWTRLFGAFAKRQRHGAIVSIDRGSMACIQILLIGWLVATQIPLQHLGLWDCGAFSLHSKPADQIN